MNPLSPVIRILSRHSVGSSDPNPPSKKRVEPGDFCLYGLVSALWMIARHDHPDSQNLLQHAPWSHESHVAGCVSSRCVKEMCI